MSKRVYLAGPEVFLPYPEKLFAEKQAICQEHGFVGISPLETHVDFSGLTPKEAAWRISRANEDCIRSCHLLIANLTPFRSPSADVGTSFEMGFMRALGRPVFGYTNATEPFFERTRMYIHGAVRPRPDGIGYEDAEGMLLESFELTDNLMLDGAVFSSRAEVVTLESPRDARFSDLRGFDACVKKAVEFFQGTGTSSSGVPSPSVQDAY